MKNLWKDEEAKKYIHDFSLKKINKDLALRIYTTHLLGNNSELVLHGGGNTSVKSNEKDIFGKDAEVIYVKGSGWDMSNLNEKGMPGLFLKPLLKTLTLQKMSDEKMVNYLRSNLLDSNSPNPSVETLLHAYLPFKYVDHTHSNAILSLVNLFNSKQILKNVFKDKIAVVPYVMPGFDLGKLCNKIIIQNPKVEGLILLNHGIFSFGSSAKQSYDRMIKLVTLAEKFLKKRNKYIKYNQYKKIDNVNDIQLKIRNYYYQLTGNKWIIKFNNKIDDVKFTKRNDLHNLFNKGPVTPDHVIRIKSEPLIIANNKLSSFNKIIKDIESYVSNYKKYFKQYKSNIKNVKIADPLPRIIILEGIGFLSIGLNKKEMLVSNDIFDAMKKVIINSKLVSNFKSISKKDIFKMEYWPLERAKLNKKAFSKFNGNVAIITGGGGKIGSAIAKKFLKENIEVVLLDKNFKQLDKNIEKKCLCISCDLTSNIQINKALFTILNNYGGIDILIANSGAAFQGSMSNIKKDVLEKSLEINFYSHHNIIQKISNIMVTQGIGGSISINLSKQSVNPGKNFGPYGIAKASSLFLMKQYALEFGKYNIRVNGINADRIKSGLLTEKFIEQRAKARNLTSSEYLNNNLLQRQVYASDVAEAFFAQLSFDKTTGNIITVDGGNIEASLR
ncbi:MAG: bifunctional aldolase/short-chain dehydrogenase [Alphaproteobacteria bacterium]